MKSTSVFKIKKCFFISVFVFGDSLVFVFGDSLAVFVGD